MSVTTLPTFEDPFYSYATTLEGRSYVLKFRYNQREDLWYLSIYLPDLTPLATGIKVVDNVNLTARVDERLPPGQLVAFTKSRNVTSPGLEEIGQTDKRFILAYISSDEPA